MANKREREANIVYLGVLLLGIIMAVLVVLFAPQKSKEEAPSKDDSNNVQHTEKTEWR